MAKIQDISWWLGRRVGRRGWAVAWGIAAAGVLAGCSVGGSGSATKTQPGASASRGLDRPPVVLVRGQRVGRDELLSLLAEAGGARVLEELALDSAIARELSARGLEVTAEQIEAERASLLDVLAFEVGLSGQSRARVEQRVRATRGLGPERWSRLLRRSASLRALVADDVEVSDAAIRLAHAERTAGVSVLRLIEVDRQRRAAELLTEIRSSADPAASFLERAVDASASPSLGGLVSVRATDPTVPEVIRKAAEGLEPGQISGVIATPRGYAILHLVRREPGDATPLEDVREELARSVRLRQEGVLMGTLAARLLAETTVTPFDPSLAWAWETSQGAGEP